MDKLIFGLVWEIFSGLMCFIFLYFGGFDLFIFLFFLIFLVVGGIVLWQGIKDVTKNKKTDFKGEICYGVITSIDADRTSVQVNGNCQYRATVEFYYPPVNGTMSLSELYGYKMHKHYVGECVKIKYYNNDINIIEGNIDINTLPYNIQDSLMGVKQNNAVPEGLYTGEENVIIINGVKYVRDDTNNNQSTL